MPSMNMTEDSYRMTLNEDDADDEDI